MVFSFLRWGDPVGALIHVGLLVFLSVAMSPRSGVAYALTSMGIDAVSWPVETVAGDRGFLVFSLWEAAAAVTVWVRIQSASRKPSK